MQKIEQNHHIAEDTWIALSNDTIAPGDYRKILEHTCGCTWCAERLASVMEEAGQTVEPPAYLKDQIWERAGRLDVQARVNVKKRSKQLRLFMYSLKVGIGVAVSVFLLVISANIQELGTTKQQVSWEQGLEQETGDLPRQALQEMQEDGDNLLVQMNRISQNAASWMNSFSNFILNGGK